MELSEWLERRKGSIGGSDASALIGLNPYSSPFSVWADKTGRLPEKPDNEAMRQGRDFEDYVAQRWCEATGKRVRREKSMLYNPQYPFAHADIDRWVIGENAGLECKTTSIMNLKKFKNGEFPPTYYVQCVHYMAVTGADRWYLGVLVLNQGFYEFVIERDEDEIQALMEQEAAFWELVKTDTPPEPDGSKPTTATIETIYADSEDGSIQLFGREGLLEEYKRLIKEQHDTAAKIRKIKQTLMVDLGEMEEGYCGRFGVSWKKQKRGFVSRDKLRATYPNLDLSKVMVVSRFRQFRIREEQDATG
jgi:putative phage-type endonuclease